MMMINFGVYLVLCFGVNREKVDNFEGDWRKDSNVAIFPRPRITVAGWTEVVWKILISGTMGIIFIGYSGS